MLVTGYKLQQGIREATTARDLAAAQFSGSLWAFEGDDQPSPEVWMKDFLAWEERLAALQVALQTYNLQVLVGDGMTLSQAVKLVGGAGRAQKMWRSAATDTGRARWEEKAAVRKLDEERATRQVAVDVAMKAAREAARRAARLRELIQSGNATEIEMDIDPALFE